ncbi:ATP-dependent nuclease [Peribacillus simplex]|uniref:DNA replication and repair protein RecF n=1 Tax=Peribacillus simplex TaxID=1478 RepID=A0A9W4KRC9_9BACI|nr:AAA family ATPase [Peribacillus simplex]CAH0169632.1 DNA replication and repair protein RecF [Peribacillus simplex]
MKIKWIEIENFRSIRERQRITLNSDLTVIAGKNESGKSTILQALKCFNEYEFSEDDSSFSNERAEPEIEVCFELDAEELLITDNQEYDVEENSKFELIVTRSDVSYYNGEVIDLGIKPFEENIKELLFKIKQVLNDNLIGVVPNDLINNKDLENNDEYLFKQKFNSFLKSVPEDTQNKYLTEFDSIKEMLKNIEDEIEKKDYFYDCINSILPKFVLFDSFTDILPNSFTNKDEKQKIIERFFSITDCRSSNLFEVNGQKRKQLSNRVSANISGDFNDYYHQDTVKIKVEPDGDDIYFFIYDKDEEIPFRPEQRSKGFQWFLSFYITLKAEEKNSILLIDEPGLYLHPKAQKDILALLEKLSLDNQVLITTHSPYLIDPDYLERIRLVNKVNGLTKIENKFYKGADKDTLTPIITSIGLDITKNMTFSNEGNVIVEGISDYYYLSAMRSFLGSQCPIKDTINIIPSVGATQSLNMIALLLGWGLEFKVLFDNDREGNRAAKKAKQNFDLNDEDIVMISNANDDQVEDLFSEDDFINYIIDDYIEKNGTKNSSKIRGTGSDKVLISKRFKERINKGDITELSDETIQKFTSLFLKLSNRKQSPALLLV